VAIWNFITAAGKPCIIQGSIRAFLSAQGHLPCAISPNVQPLHNAGPADLTFFDNRKYTGQLVTTLAGACILAGVDAGRVPIATATLTTVAPSSAFAPH
jgi:UDP-3-O-[3-hydroxymyristoyl] glucosamine N-acyltransferase